MSGMAILHALAGGAPTVTVTIPEGSNLYEIDKTLADAGVIYARRPYQFQGLRKS